MNPIQIILDGVLQRQVDFKYQPRWHARKLNPNRQVPREKVRQVKNLQKVLKSGDVITIKRKSKLADAIMEYSRTPYGRPLVNHWLLLKAMVRKPRMKPKVMPVMLFANGVFRDKLAPENFFMWMLTNFDV